MGLFGKLFGGERREAPRKKEVPKGPEKAKSIEEKIRDLEQSFQEVQEKHDAASHTMSQLEKKKLEDGPFATEVAEMIQAHSAVKIRLQEAENLLKESLSHEIPSKFVEEAAQQENFTDAIHQKLAYVNWPWSARSERIRSLVYRLRRLEGNLRAWREDAYSAQQAYEDYKRGTITVEREEKVLREKPAEPGEFRGRHVIERKKEEIPGQPGWKEVRDVIREAREKAKLQKARGY